MASKPERSSPTLLPGVAKVDRKVFLSEEHWQRLTDLAAFHEDVFRKMGSKESVSRNEIIENFLAWAEDEYWAEIDGPPTSAAEREQAIAAKVAILTEKQAAKDKTPAPAKSHRAQSR